MKLVIASITLMLAACTASQAPPEVFAQPADSAASVAANAASSSEAPAAKRAPGQENADPLQIFRAFGTEPFWNVNVEDATLTFTTPDDQDGKVMQGQRRMADAGVDINGSVDGQPFSLSVRPGACSDGMSDNEYDMTSTFQLGDARYTGCGEAAK